MKKDDVRVGSTYSAKVSGAVVSVRITQEKWKGDKQTGWVGTNTETGRSVYNKSAQRLRAAGGQPRPARRRRSIRPGSSIVCTASINSYDPSPAILDYAMTKGAVAIFVKGLPKQLIPKGIRVNGVAPGPIWTPLQPGGAGGNVRAPGVERLELRQRRDPRGDRRAPNGLGRDSRAANRIGS